MEYGQKGARIAGHYEILGLVGQGSSGTVHKARDLRLPRFVALKFLAPDLLDEPEARLRFAREAHAIAALSHANIAVIYDIGESGGVPYIVLEWLGGGSLASRIHNRRLSLAEILLYARQLAAGLGHAHSQGVVHRDLKPGNALFSDAGVLKLVDFGLAMVRSAGDASRQEIICGTPGYMAPEQVRGGEVDHRCDIWAFGVLLYRLAAGHPPFHSQRAEDVFKQILESDPPPLDSIRPDLPPLFHGLVAGALRKEPSQRPPNMRSVLEELEAIENEHLRSVGLPTSGDSAPTARPEDETLSLMTPAAASARGTARKESSGSRLLSWTLLALFLVLAAAGGYRLVRGIVAHRGESQRARCVVVLPFNCRGEEADSKSFCAGLNAELAYLLQQSQRFQQSFWTVSPAEIANSNIRTSGDARRQVGAALAVGGTVVTKEDGYQIQLDLTDAATNRMLAQQPVTVSRGDALMLRSNLLRTALGMLDATVPSSGLVELSASQTRNPESYELCVRARGLLLKFAGQETLLQAISLLERAAGMDNRNALARALLSQAWLQQFSETRNPDHILTAAAEAEKARQIAPDDLEVLVAVGRVQRRQSKYEDAINTFRRALRLNPRDGEIYRLLAITFESVNRFEEALDTYRRALEVNPEYWPALHNRGWLYFNLRQYDKARRDLENAVRLAPGNAPAVRDLGTCYANLGLYDEAAKHYDKAFALGGGYTVLTAYGYMRYRQKNYAESARLFEEATRYPQRDTLVFYNLGQALERMAGRESDARAAYTQSAQLAEKLLAVSPSDAEVLARYAVCLTKTGRRSEAGKAIGRALEIQPSSIPILIKAALIELVDGDKSAALNLLSRAIRLGEDPKDILEDPDFGELARDPAAARRLAAQQPARRK
jgi:serine/threonine-protein kinase